MLQKQHQPSAPPMEDEMKTAIASGEVEMQTLLSLPGTRCFTINQGERIQLGHGELNVCAMDDETLLLYIPKTFHYAITKKFPSLRATKYSFVFPGANGICFGVMFSINTSIDDLDMFEGLLSEFSEYAIDEELQQTEKNKKTNELDEKKTSSTTDTNKNQEYVTKGKKVASYINKGAVLAQKGIKKGTKAAAKGIGKSKEYIKNKIKIRKEINVSEKTKSRIKKAKLVSKGVVKVSAAVVVGAKVMCNELANSAADAVSKTEYGLKFKNSKSGKLTAVKDIGKASINATLTIIEELHLAAIILVSEVADASADVAHYKYGKQVGGCSDDVAEIVKDSSHVVKNVYDLGLKSMARTVVGNGAIDMMSNENEKQMNREIRKQQYGTVDPDIKSAAVIAKNVAMMNIENTQNGKQKYNM